MSEAREPGRGPTGRGTFVMSRSDDARGAEFSLRMRRVTVTAGVIRAVLIVRALRAPHMMGRGTTDGWPTMGGPSRTSWWLPPRFAAAKVTNLLPALFRQRDGDERTT